MKKNTHTIGLLTAEQRNVATKEIINYFASETDEEMGFIAAEDLLDMFLDQIGIQLYNKGVEDTKQYIQKNFESIAFDIEINLKK